MIAYRPRWRADASGHVAAFAGLWAGQPFQDRALLERIVRESPNGAQIEIVTVMTDTGDPVVLTTAPEED